jgi:hypothetical protein
VASCCYTAGDKPEHLHQIKLNPKKRRTDITNFCQLHVLSDTEQLLTGKFNEIFKLFEHSEGVEMKMSFLISAKSHTQKFCRFPTFLFYRTGQLRQGKLIQDDFDRTAMGRTASA